MADATSSVTLEFHGALADRFIALGRRHGTRTQVMVPLGASTTVVDLLDRLATDDSRYAHLFDVTTRVLPEHVEAVLNDRVLDLQGGLNANLNPGDVLSFLPAHAGG